GLVGTGVFRVRDAVVVDVLLGTPIVVLDTVLVLGIVGTLVLGVDDAVLVSVRGRRAAVRWLGRQAVFLDRGALVDVVRVAIAVGVLGVVLGVGHDGQLLGWRLGFGVAEAPRVAERGQEAHVGGAIAIGQ